MTITETNHIERVVLAFRGDVDGSFKGAHLERFRVLKQDGVEIARTPGKATTISEASAAGFTWPEVAAEINAGLIITSEAQAAQIAALTADKAAADEAKATAEAARDAALVEKQALAVKLQEYESPTDVNGVPSWVYASQAYKALIQAGSMAYVKGLLAADTSIEGQMALADFEKSARFYRDNPTLNKFVSNGTFTSAQMDDLFRLAATFTV